MLRKVTITGADDSIRPVELLPLSIEFPFVEWGILVSAKQMGNTRFPSLSWLKELANIHNSCSIDLSCHLCGGLVRNLIIGTFSFEYNYPNIFSMFNRVQLNFHAEVLKYNAAALLKVLEVYPTKEWICQLDGTNNVEIFWATPGTYGLFDTSHGAGILPDSWPKPLNFAYTGYAGGLGPDNLQKQIPAILKAAGETDIWIDMETQVRSNDDKQFDLEKVRKCLEISKQFVTEDIV